MLALQSTSTAPPGPRTLVLEEGDVSTDRLRIGLTLDGHVVSVGANTPAVFDQLRRGDHDVVILSGSACEMPHRIRRVRACDDEVLVLALVAGGDEADVVMGLRMGADVYVLEPYSVLETLARVNALLRRYQRVAAPPAPDASPGVLRFEDLEIDLQQRTVFKGGSAVPLTDKEFALLAAVARRRGAPASRAELLEEIWGTVSSPTRRIDVLVAEVRRKLEEDAAQPRFLLTQWRVGYRLAFAPTPAE